MISTTKYLKTNIYAVLLSFAIMHFMLNAKDKYDLYEKMKHILEKNDFTVNPFREIQYGLQFICFLHERDALLRVYQGKKGLKLDFSMCKDEGLAENIAVLVDSTDQLYSRAKEISKHYEKDGPDTTLPTTDPEDLIGVDESGKGDYFGPLVIASVHSDKATNKKLIDLGVQDSKKLTDERMLKMAPKIMDLCEHSIILMSCNSYNDVYERMQNLNHLLAWGHGKAIEQVLNDCECENVLSDQFGHASLVKNALRAKGITVNLFQRPRAESNIAVAAASILARATFVEEITNMGTHYNMTFPKGCSDKTLNAGMTFCQDHGREQLPLVAKLHFNLTGKIDGSLTKNEE
jgi:ribonuclease HIII